MIVRAIKIVADARIENECWPLQLTSTHLCCWGIYVRHAWQQKLNVVTKDKILFCCSIANVKLGQKLSSEPKVETRYSAAPIAQMPMLAAVFPINRFLSLVTRMN